MALGSLKVLTMRSSSVCGVLPFSLCTLLFLSLIESPRPYLSATQGEKATREPLALISSSLCLAVGIGVATPKPRYS